MRKVGTSGILPHRNTKNNYCKIQIVNEKEIQIFQIQKSKQKVTQDGGGVYVKSWDKRDPPAPSEGGEGCITKIQNYIPSKYKL